MPTLNENLYTIKVTQTDYHLDPSGALQHVLLAGTYTSLASAKTAAHTTLYTLGYTTLDLPTYEIKGQSTGLPQEWKYGDGVLVHATAPSGEQFQVEIETTENTLKPWEKHDATSKLTEKLYYVLQTTIHYDLDAAGAKRDTNIEGIHASRVEATKAAKKSLLEKDVTSKESFVEYDEFAGQEDWAFGENVVVHAVGGNGQNYEVAVVEGREVFSAEGKQGW